MNLEQSTPQGGESEPSPTLGQHDCAVEGRAQGWPAFGDGVVAMRSPADHELEREREERIESVVRDHRRGGLRLRVGRPGLLAAGLLLALVAGYALLGSGGGDSRKASPGVAADAPAANTTAPARHAKRTDEREIIQAARARRRAAVRARKQAARRRARRVNAKTQERPSPSAPIAPSAPIEESPPPSAAPAPPASSDPSPVETEFGFER